MWVGAQKEVTKDMEIGVEAFDAPLHWEGINGYHHALVFGQTSILGSDVLIDTRNDAGRSQIATQDGVFSCSSVFSAHDR